MVHHSVHAALSSLGGGRRRSSSTQDDTSKLRTPIPPYRHATPSAPWPWMDFDIDESAVGPLSPGGSASPSSRWEKYPQSLFKNWTPDQVERSKMLTNCSDSQPCSIYNVEVRDDGHFDQIAGGRTITVTADSASYQEFWDELQQPRSEGIRIRAFFVDNLSLHVLKMLGTTFNIEPFFFSSSTNRIPSRYQEDAKAGYGDHITVTLPFISTMRKPDSRLPNFSSVGLANSLRKPTHEVLEVHNQAPLELTHGVLLQDLLAIHMVRRKDSSTIISYHPISHLKETSAKRLQSLVQRTGDSVYWSKLFERSRDPTFVFLAILWYPLYAWDEAFEVLYRHINKLESQVLGTNDINLTRELHKMQAYLLHCQQLLQDFHKSVEFVKNTPNPAMDDEEDKDFSAQLLAREVDNLLSEIGRLEGQRTILSDRLKNVMRLAFATVNMEDSRAMKRISYLTMIFLPASLIASVFGMNVAEINPGTYENLSHYAEATIALTALTVWLVIAMQTESSFWPKGSGWWRRLAWPIFFTTACIKESYLRQRGASQTTEQPAMSFVVTSPGSWTQDVV
ncbi:cora-like Mg2+ transporter protein-domain-containing protein [Pisolithus marmoratus]|nr:cora-like Mg2+ transporter protein-domain-containing protein [Pisolithus marmoratus]